ncbi:hypothetical protein BRYFOR_05236 [Marvinbryantia formatexigens DSM 14469]|uniref:Uncharacterized protein n=1 Tax=Marvinbryantia formatexigens DSM 14469 TaxID=478749 RepID=C6L9E6_9FIRM|nr:hypothetical protein BRYFOR_05236 [Marvinbryantia formatexigens DSM 14469]
MKTGGVYPLVFLLPGIQRKLLVAGPASCQASGENCRCDKPGRRL